jgi:Tfp pilus assembly protein PilV
MESDMNSKTSSPITVPSKMVAKKTDERGFTLLETAIALVVMMVMALAAASLFVFAVKYDTGANDRAIALAIAQQRMERLRKTRFSDAIFATPSLTESYTSAGHPYTIVTTICSTSDCGGSAVLKVITVQVTPAATSSQWASTAATVISQRSTLSLGPYRQ